MRFGQYANLNVDRAYRAQVAAVDARRTVQNAFAHDGLLELAERIRHVARFELRRVSSSQLLRLRAELAHAGLALHLVGDAVGIAQLSLHRVRDCAVQRFVDRLFFEFPLGLARFLCQLGDHIDHLLHFHVAEQDRAQHLVFGEAFGFGFHHQHGVLGARYHHVEHGGLERRVAGVEEVVAVHITHPRTADRASKRNARNRERRGRTDHRCNIRILILLRRHDRQHHLNFIHEAFREQRTDGTVDQTARQRFFLAGPTFTPEEAAGDLTGCVGFLLVVHREREEALVRIGRTCANHRGQNHGVVERYHDRAGSLTGNLARFQDQLVLSELNFLSYWIQNLLFLSLFSSI